MNFEDDVEGTGMGEGDGKNDVTDQLENEEQLLGLKNDEQNEAEEKKKESKQLNEEEAKQGMEMEADFEGELCDVPDDLKDDDNESNGNDEELDRKMGDGQDPNEEVVDEQTVKIMVMPTVNSSFQYPTKRALAKFWEKQWRKKLFTSTKKWNVSSLRSPTAMLSQRNKTPEKWLRHKSKDPQNRRGTPSRCLIQ